MIKGSKRTIVLFDQSKGEVLRVSDNLKGFQRRLRPSWRVEVNKEELSEEALDGVALLVLPGPREGFTEIEINAIRGFIASGGALLVTLGEGGERSYGTNINYLLEEHGIMVNNDCVVRTHYYKYFHPKECLVQNGVVNRAVAELVGKPQDFPTSVRFVYPFGATLNTAPPAVVLLSTGSVAFPLRRPVCAVSSVSGGKIAVLGSGQVIADRYIDKEDNCLVVDLLIAYLLSDGLTPNAVDADDPEVYDYTAVADTGGLSERLRPALVATSDESLADSLALFRSPLYSVSLEAVEDVASSYAELGIRREPLALIPPAFDAPLPPLRVAVFPPRFRDLPPPALELYDLEEELSSERAKLAHSANRRLGASEDKADVEYFTMECAAILGLARRSPFDVLVSVASTLAAFKRSTE